MQGTIRNSQDLFNDTLELATKIVTAKKKYDAIVGISPGGIIIARMLGDFLNCQIVFNFEMFGQESEALENKESPVKLNLSPNQIKFLQSKKVLLVDDVVNSGDTMIVAIELLQGNCSCEIDTLALYTRPYTKIDLTYSLRELEHLIVMPYEYATIIRYLLHEQQVPLKEVREFFPRDTFDKLKVLLDLPRKP